jgi:hypothetical protein
MLPTIARDRLGFSSVYDTTRSREIVHHASFTSAGSNGSLPKTPDLTVYIGVLLGN